MKKLPGSDEVLLVDDGELEDVALVLDREGIAYRRLRGGQIPDEVPPPRDLLIVTPRRVERVRRGSPADARPGRPLRIIATDEDSPAMRRRLRRSGLHLLIRLPADPEIWRLLIARALYRGSERREDPRVPVGSPVELTGAADTSETMLLDLSNRGCRLRTRAPLSVGDTIEFTIAEEQGDAGEPLALRGTVKRLATPAGPGTASTVAMLFDPTLSEHTRTRLTGLINHWASGPSSMEHSAAESGPTIPPCRLPSLPDLMLDDETDPPIAARHAVRVQLADEREDAGKERRDGPRGHFASSIEAIGEEGPFVLIGRDLSSGGMRIERHPDLAVGDRFQLALRGPSLDVPLVVDTRVIRDDGAAGFVLSFESIDSTAARALEKMVACLPDVESLEDGELAGLGAILSEIIDHR